MKLLLLYVTAENFKFNLPFQGLLNSFTPVLDIFNMADGGMNVDVYSGTRGKNEKRQFTTDDYYASYANQN